jgi:UDP-GlcNAc:undecaprenyl-phosphate GlcNAc-1-phosphate transferase
MPAVISIAHRTGAVDHPGHLKPHERAMPVLGGVAIVFGAVLATSIAITVQAAPDAAAARVAIALLVASMAVAGLGLIDDLRGLSPRLRLAAELAIAATWVIWAWTSGQLPHPVLIPVGVLWLVGLTNAVNMIDGLDGLAGTCGLVGGAAVSMLGAHRGDAASAILGACLAGGCLGFLVFNRPPARVFMGDAGAYFLGFMAGGLVLIAGASDAKGSPDWSSLLGVSVVWGVPVADIVLAMTRRILSGHPPFSGDRSHFYDQIRDRWGTTVPQTLGVMAIGYLAYALAGLGISHLPALWALLATAGTVLVTVVGLIAGRFFSPEAEG